MSKKEIYKKGYDRGLYIGSLQNLPEIGTEIELDDFYGIIEDVIDLETVFEELCYTAETSDRDFSPFEFTAKELNDLEKIEYYEVWEEFEKGITDGIKRNWKKRKKDFPAKE